MQQAIYALPDHLTEARGLCRKFTLPRFQAEQVVILGMGGSAIGGDLARVIAEQSSTGPKMGTVPKQRFPQEKGLSPFSAIPIHVVRNEELPRFVNEKTLVVAVSYSGNTGETLSSMTTALERTPQVLAVSTGGKLKEIAQRRRLPYLEIPGGLMPRAALAYTFVPMLHVLQNVCGLSEEAVNLDESITILKTMREKFAVDGESNEARKISKSLHGKIPIIYSPAPLLAPAARRWKCQINENAKQPAFFDVFPEATHNSIVGFTNPLPIHQSLMAVFLRDSGETDLVQKRINFMKSVLSKSGTQVHEAQSLGKLFITRLLSLCYFGDYVSLYLANENGVDPTPIAVIDELKSALVSARTL